MRQLTLGFDCANAGMGNAAETSDPAPTAVAAPKNCRRFMKSSLNDPFGRKSKALLRHKNFLRCGNKMLHHLL